jgi:hypothetical protein
MTDEAIIKTADVEIRIPKKKLSREVMIIISEFLDELSKFENKRNELILEKEEEHAEFELINNRDISDEEFEKYVSRVPNRNEIKKYIISQEDYRHSIRDIEVLYLGVVLTPNSEFRNQQNLYQRIYQRIRRIQQQIQKQEKGKWKSKYIMAHDEENKYKEWWFLRNESRKRQI